MEYRSSNAGQHLSNDFVSNVGSSHGVQLTGGSTGGVVEAVGDDTDITLRLRGKGAGGVIIGNSSQTVTIAGGTAFKGFVASTFTAQFAAISSGQVSTVGLSTATNLPVAGDLVSLDMTITPATAIYGGFRMSSVATSALVMLIANPGSTATSTGRVVGRVVWADLT